MGNVLLLPASAPAPSTPAQALHRFRLAARRADPRSVRAPAVGRCPAQNVHLPLRRTGPELWFGSLTTNGPVYVYG